MRRFSRVEAAVEAIANGKAVIVTDSEDRENEGDFVGAAEQVSAEMVHFMISEGRGQLCMPVLPETARRLNLTPMVKHTDMFAPRFAVPIDHASCATGISPEERAFSIRAIADPSTHAGDFIKPGHIFPLIAQEQGVLRRPGHTEATVDLVRLAGFNGSGLLCEICSRDGRQMANGSELIELAEEFELPIVSIDELIEFRRQLTGVLQEAGAPPASAPIPQELQLLPG